MHFFTKTLMHTIKTHTFFMSLCQKTCSDDKKHLHEPQVSQVSQIL